MKNNNKSNKDLSKSDDLSIDMNSSLLENPFSDVESDSMDKSPVNTIFSQKFEKEEKLDLTKRPQMIRTESIMEGGDILLDKNLDQSFINFDSEVNSSFFKSLQNSAQSEDNSINSLPQNPYNSVASNQEVMLKNSIKFVDAEKKSLKAVLDSQEMIATTHYKKGR